MYKHTILNLIAVLLFCFALLASVNANAQTPAGSMTSVTGDVHVERGGTSVPATTGMTVDVGDRLVTGPNSRATVTLADKSSLELDESTAMVIDQETVSPTSRNTKLSVFGGLVRSFVSYSSSPTPNFEVHTPNAVASARGTEYDTSTQTQAPNTMSEEDKKKYKDCRRFTQVSVYQGTVEVINTTNPSGGSVQVPAGHKTMVVCALPPFPPSEMGAAAAGAAAAGAGGAGAIAGSTAGLLVGGAIVVGGTAGGLAAGGAFNGSSSRNRTPQSPAK
jgi:FecR protein